MRESYLLYDISVFLLVYAETSFMIIFYLISLFRRPNSLPGGIYKENSQGPINSRSLNWRIDAICVQCLYSIDGVIRRDSLTQNIII